MGLNETKPATGTSHRRLAVGALAGSLANITRLGVQLLMLPLMARLLGPSEFGLYALALPTVSLLSLLADGGLGATLAREEESETLVWSSAFWMLLGMGIVLVVGSTLLGFFLGHVSNQPRLPGLIGVLSVSLLFLTLSAVPSAKLTRRKSLITQAVVDLTAALVGAVTAVIMAWQGMGAASLVGQYVTTYAIRALLLNIVAFFVPSFHFSFEAIRTHFVSGGLLVTSRIVEYAGRAAENFVTDRIFGTALLGSYNFGNQVSKFATDTLANPIWGAIYVQALTEDKATLVKLHRQLCRLLAVVLFPATFLAAAAAPDLIEVLIGPKWPDLSLILRVLLPTYAFAAMGIQTGPILLASGRFDLQLWCMVGMTLGRVFSLALGLWFGLTFAILGVAASTLGFCIAMMVVPAHVTGCELRPLVAVLLRPFVCALIATAAFFAVYLQASPSWMWSLVGMAAGLVTYAIAMLLIDRAALLQDWSAVRNVLFKRRSA